MEDSKLPNISPIEVSAAVSVAKSGSLKPTIEALKSSLPTPAVAMPLGEERRETHIMTDKRRAALSKARGAKEVKRIKFNAELEAQQRINLELGQVLQDMRSALREFQQAKPLPLSNVAVMEHPTLDEVLDNTPVATLPNALEDPALVSLKQAPVVRAEGFEAFLQNKVRF